MIIMIMVWCLIIFFVLSWFIESSLSNEPEPDWETRCLSSPGGDQKPGKKMAGRHIAVSMDWFKGKS